MLTETKSRLAAWLSAVCNWGWRNFTGCTAWVCQASLMGASLVAATWLSEMLWPGWAGRALFFLGSMALRERGEIPTDFGEKLSWAYLCNVREHPIAWRVPTEILYAGGDHLVSRRTVERFAAAHGAGLTVLEGGEHWFHTEEQLAFLDGWVKKFLF